MGKFCLRHEDLVQTAKAKINLHICTVLSFWLFAYTESNNIFTLGIRTDKGLPNYLPGMVGCGEGVVYLASPGRPTDIGLQLGNACYPCSR